MESIFSATGWKYAYLWHVYSIFYYNFKNFPLNLSPSISSIIFIFPLENSNDLSTIIYWLFSLWSFLTIFKFSCFPFYFLKSISVTLMFETSNLFYSPSTFIFVSLMAFFFFHMFLKLSLLKTWIIALVFQCKPLNLWCILFWWSLGSAIPWSPWQSPSFAVSFCLISAAIYIFLIVNEKTSCQYVKAFCKWLVLCKCRLFCCWYCLQYDDKMKICIGRWGFSPTKVEGGLKNEITEGYWHIKLVNLFIILNSIYHL